MTNHEHSIFDELLIPDNGDAIEPSSMEIGNVMVVGVRAKSSADIEKQERGYLNHPTEVEFTEAENE